MILRGEKGTVFLTTMVVTFLILMVGSSVFSLCSQELFLAKSLNKATQAQNLADAGLSEAIAVLSVSFSKKNNPANFPLRTLANGTYDVTVVESGGRVLLKSAGTVDNIQKTATAEVEDLTPTALNYGEAAGGNIKLDTIFLAMSLINGDLFANQDVTLKAYFLALIDVNGNVFAGGSATRQGNVDWYSATSNAGNITFPVYDFNYYKAIAQANGTYYAAAQTWTNKSFNLNNTGGVLFVDGDVTFWGLNNSLTGCLVTTGTVRLYGTLTQAKAANYPTYPAIMTSDKDILCFSVGKLFADGLVYAGKDLSLLGVFSRIKVTGSVIAKGTLKQANLVNYLEINYLAQNPPGLILPGGATNPTRVKSYNK